MGCSHGQLADPSALEAVIKFRDEFRPDKRIHLGDAVDTTAFRTGAKGSSDETASVSDDIASGLTFLERFRPTTFFNGNHEWRLWKDASKPNAVIAHAATVTIKELRAFIKDELKADYVESYNWDSWRMLGNYKVGHGIAFNENAVRDHAERAGNCIIAHLHRQEVAHGRRLDRPTCVSIGYLGDADKFTYADLWPGKLKWNTGWCYGEFNDDQCVWQLHRHINQQQQGKTYLPV